MATKTISIELDVYERLKRLKLGASDSFSQVLRRNLPEPTHWTAGDLLRAIESGEWKGIGISEEGMRVVEEADRFVLPPDDPWSGPLG